MDVARRQFLIGGTASLAALCACDRLMARQPRVPVVGFLSNVAAAESQFFPGFVEGLREEGLIDGVNLRIEQRFADGKNELLPGYAAELIALGVQVLCATGGTVPP